ncbi:MAG: PaaI family thioesterase [Actinomycetia bacterium]|nr:PaaI family thioesterase [Actinomycetes bacterium]MCP4085345.1 PaaI family thioesterase [Actinomycetes bacterium]
MNVDPPPEELSELDSARIRLANAIRAVSHGVIEHDPDPDLLHRLAATLEMAVPDIEVTPPRDRLLVSWEQRLDSNPPAQGESLSSGLLRPVYGPANPFGLPYEPRVDGHDAVTTVTLGAAHEGAPGRSHGGIVAALFDDLFGFVLDIEQTIAFTGWLRVTYRGPVPINEPVEYRARLRGREGRKLSMTGEARYDGEVVIEADALFIELDPDHLRSLMGPDAQPT